MMDYNLMLKIINAFCVPSLRNLDILFNNFIGEMYCFGEQRKEQETGSQKFTNQYPEELKKNN
jgi:hypothetical protein